MSYKVGIVEDEFITAEYLNDLLVKNGHEVVCRCDTAQEALAQLFHEESISSIDILCLDIKLKGEIDGIAIAQEIRKKKLPIQIIYITAYNDNNTIKEVSATMPCYYLVKPFNEQDLLIALSFATTTIKNDKNTYLIDGFLYSKKDKMLHKNEKEVKLTNMEIIVLEYLIDNKERVVAYEEIFNCIPSTYPTLDILRTTIKAIRKKSSKNLIQNLSGQGYKVNTNDVF
ncbi:response regulator transcription factor [Sulfurospirillum arcachonense]|uniref:response regulator transcription factor n=1 Tax=Sulfurospirillum arcachonense TaxID=57666 RepID=UPI000469E648|nr:DNA-binding response regulator [Sulfurospirillum arcachonense]